jgi:hypothetical protein
MALNTCIVLMIPRGSRRFFFLRRMCGWGAGENKFDSHLLQGFCVHIGEQRALE